MTDGPKDSMLVIACYFKNGEGTMPGAVELADKLSRMLTGEMGLFLVYSTDPPISTPPVVHWWDGKTPPFKCYAKQDCKVWKIGINDPIHVGIADTVTPWAVEVAGYAMDVSQVVVTPNAPTWFIVAHSGSYKWICLAAETTEKGA